MNYNFKFEINDWITDGEKEYLVRKIEIRDDGIRYLVKEDEDSIYLKPINEKDIDKYSKVIPLLDEKEKAYLEAVLKPYKVKWIQKRSLNESEYILITVYNYVCHFDDIALPLFKPNSMYKGLEAKKRYTPEELGLEELKNE